jgi:hypothetical protein
MAAPVLSTSHLSRETMQAIESRTFVSAALDTATYREGAFLRFYEEVQEEDLAAIPPDLRAMRDYAIQSHMTWVRVDADGDFLPQLKVFNW